MTRTRLGLFLCALLAPALVPLDARAGCFSYSTGTLATHQCGSVSGTTIHSGRTSFHSFSNGVSGTTHRLNGLSMHSFSNGVTGTTIHSGNVDFHHFNDGSTGTTFHIGGTALHTRQGGGARPLGFGDPDR
jgi:hypothetical protein